MCPFVAAYTGFMWMLLLVAYGEKDPNAFFLKRHIRDSFSQGTKDSMSPGDVFTWANTLLLKNLFGVYPGKGVSLMQRAEIILQLTPLRVKAAFLCFVCVFVKPRMFCSKTVSCINLGCPPENVLLSSFGI